MRDKSHEKGPRNDFDQEYTMENSWKNRWKIVYKMKPRLHLIKLHQYFAQPNVDELLVNLSSLFAIVLKVGNFLCNTRKTDISKDIRISKPVKSGSTFHSQANLGS